MTLLLTNSAEVHEYLCYLFDSGQLPSVDINLTVRQDHIEPFLDYYLHSNQGNNYDSESPNLG